MPTPVSWPLWVPTEAAGTATGVASASGDAEVVSGIRLTIESVSAPLRTKVHVVFSNAVKMTNDVSGALRLANYNLSGVILESVEEIDYREVLLTTSPLNVETLYTLTVDNVEDVLGNPISPA